MIRRHVLTGLTVHELIPGLEVKKEFYVYWNFSLISVPPVMIVSDSNFCNIFLDILREKIEP